MRRDRRRDGRLWCVYRQQGDGGLSWGGGDRRIAGIGLALQAIDRVELRGVNVSFGAELHTEERGQHYCRHDSQDRPILERAHGYKITSKTAPNIAKMP